MDEGQAVEQAWAEFESGFQKMRNAFSIVGQQAIEDMNKSESYDPTKSYDEKNYYVVNANDFGIRLLGYKPSPNADAPLHPAFADIFYRNLLNTILMFEKKTGKHFNKGVVYANLGIAQIAQGKFDAGIAHLLTAEWEDREVASSQIFILDTLLWEQFERKVFDYLIEYNHKRNFRFKIDDTYLKTFFAGIDREDRIFLQGTILALIDNLELYKNSANSYTYGRLYSTLKDLCLLTESLLHKKQTALGNSQKDLYNLLVITLKSQNMKWPSKSNPPKAKSLNDFVDKLEKIINAGNSDLIRWADCVYLVRNFTGHHFKIDETIKSANGNSFFKDLYIPTLENTLSLLLYLNHIGAI